MKRRVKSKAAKIKTAESLVTKATETTDVELKEDELKKVSGGLIALLNKGQ